MTVYSSEAFNREFAKVDAEVERTFRELKALRVSEELQRATERKARVSRVMQATMTDRRKAGVPAFYVPQEIFPPQFRQRARRVNFLAFAIFCVLAGGMLYAIYELAWGGR